MNDECFVYLLLFVYDMDAVIHNLTESFIQIFPAQLIENALQMPEELNAKMLKYYKFFFGLCRFHQSPSPALILDRKNEYTV